MIDPIRLTVAPAPAWAVPVVPRRRFPIFEVVLGALGLACVALSVLGYLALADAYSVGHVAVLALGPLGVVVLVMRHLDRWEPEPARTLFAAFAWGAGVAILIASLLNSAFLFGADAVLADRSAAMRLTAVVSAPLVEETMKGLGLLLVVAWRRHEIHSIVDGVVYAGFAGAGFAFIENMQYFLQASAESATVLTVMVILRGVLSPFVHPMATSFTGAALAWGVVRGRTGSGRLGVAVLGWCAAVLVHGLWNLLGSSADPTVWLTSYVLVELPLFLAWLAAVLALSSADAKRIRRGLAAYVAGGWVLPAEIEMASSSSARRNARVWARTGGPDAERAMGSLLVELAALGLDQGIQERLGARSERLERDRALLASATAHRSELIAALSSRGGSR